MNVYLDNAATTPIDPEVIDAMVPILKENYGNPSSVHSDGRVARALIEQCRKNIAAHFNAAPSEIYFTSGGTEADNMILRCAVRELGVDHIITSPLEHHAVLHPSEELGKLDHVELSLIKVNELGMIDLEHLKVLLQKGKKTIVSLMHANNEIATICPLDEVGAICEEYGAYFHSDTVQTIGHYHLNFKSLGLHFANCSAHKFHGPKGIGFIYIDKEVKMHPMITGGAQERNMRAGTENIYGIVGLTKALELAYQRLEEHQKHVQGLKTQLIDGLKKIVPDVHFNGDSESKSSLYTVLNVCFPNTDMDEMLLYNFDIAGISCSSGSACTSGSNTGSHVLRAIGSHPDRPSIRFSFGRFNTAQDIEKCIAAVDQIFNKK